jgi:hypothetical protein
MLIRRLLPPGERLTDAGEQRTIPSREGVFATRAVFPPLWRVE